MIDNRNFKLLLSEQSVFVKQSLHLSSGSQVYFALVYIQHMAEAGQS